MNSDSCDACARAAALPSANRLDLGDPCNPTAAVDAAILDPMPCVLPVALLQTPAPRRQTVPLSSR